MQGYFHHFFKFLNAKQALFLLKQTMIMKHILKLNFSKIKQAQLINPYTHAPLTSHPYLTQSQIYSKITNTAAAQQKWKQIPFGQRITYVQKFMESVINDETILKPLIAQSIGKSYKHIHEEFTKLKNVSNELVNDGNEILQKKILPAKQAQKKILTFQPVGLAMIFPYFSEPIFDSLIHIVPCLISGSATLLKPSEYNYFLGEYLRNKADSTLLYPNLVSDLYFHPDQLSQIKQFRAIKKIIFSGSQTSARHIFQVLVKNRFIDCNLFFGGQDAAYVDPTADLEKAAKEICKYSFYNCGQSYDGIKRLYLHQSIQDKFIQLIAAQISQLVIGDPKNETTDLGPLTIPQVSMDFQKLVYDAVTDDASCVIGGLVTTDGITSGIFCQPTLLKNCSSDMEVVQRQINAPILCCITVRDDQQFFQQVNETRFGTGIRIFTKETEKYSRRMKQLDVGYIALNSGSILNKNLPIEGWKQSGKGKILSELAFEEYITPKSYHIEELGKK